MSTTEQKETEYVAGTISGITQKGPDKWQIHVQPDGSQYAKNLWTKDAELVASVSEKIGQHGAFVCGISLWTNNEGKQVRSLWINDATEEQLDDLRVNATVTQSAAQVVIGSENLRPASDGMTPEKWDRKDSAIHKMACIKTAADALKHTMPSQPTPEDLRQFIENVKTLSRNWHLQVMAVREGDDSDVPFLSAHDEAIPF